MSYRVSLQRLAKEDLDQAYLRAAQSAPRTAARWLQRFQAALLSLEKNPARCPTAPEDRKLSRGLREFHFGRRPQVFRVVFVIEHDRVRILRIRRAQRRFMSSAEIDQVLSDDS